MLWFCGVRNPGPEVPSNGSLEHLKHETEKGSGQGCIPPSFGLLVTDECMLRLHLQKL